MTFVDLLVLPSADAGFTVQAVVAGNRCADSANQLGVARPEETR
jgi:hypothetical protein